MSSGESLTPEEKQAFVEAVKAESARFLARKATPAALARMRKFRADQAASAATEGDRHDENSPLGPATGTSADGDRGTDSSA